ncbi:MAG: TorF family putative porin [Gammaproteobacteria bacterium]|nr:TorF family putative porin [Gammaproteobacteria bacterium]
MKGLTKTLIAGSVMAASSMAMAEFTGNVALTSDYVFRGYSQTQGDMAIQGGFDFSDKSGIYAGVWASNVESDPAAPVNYNSASIEVDLYAGWSGEFSGVGVDAGFLRYQYPGTNTDTNNTDEYHIGVSKDIGPVSAGLTFNYSPDFFGADDATYWDLGLEMPVTKTVTASVHYGMTDYDDNARGDDYKDWSVGLSTEMRGVGLDLTYTDTSGVAGGCATDVCDGRVIFTVSKEF